MISEQTWSWAYGNYVPNYVLINGARVLVSFTVYSQPGQPLNIIDYPDHDNIYYIYMNGILLKKKKYFEQ